MKQVVQNFRTGELKVEDLPPPALRAGGVLVETRYSLISAGTERSIVETAQSSLIGKARTRPDLVRQLLDTLKREGLRATYEKVRSRLNQIKALGYSAAGVVSAVGDGVDDLKIGDAVACAGAGYASHAEDIFVPRNLVCRVPDGVSLESACYTTVGSIALHGVRQADARLGETVAVIGLGLVGQLAVQMLKASSCRVAGYDIDPLACELGKKSGADVVASDPDRARRAVEAMTGGHGADCIIITAGTTSNGPVELAAELARDRARVVVVGLVGMDIPRQSFYMKELELRLSRSYGPGRYDAEYEEKGRDYPIGYVRWTERRNMEAFLQLVADQRVRTDLLTTHRFALDQAETAYKTIMGGGGERYCGVVLEYPKRERAPSIKSHRKVETREGRPGVGFIGAGNFARGVLLPLVRRTSDIEMTGVATATGISASNTADQFGFSYSTTDPSKILDDERTTCVFIATRHDTHSRLAAESLKRGKSVFLEKPLATTLDGLREVTQAARLSEGLLLVGFNRRFAPLAMRIKSSLDDRLGPMTIVYRVNTGQLPAEHWSLDEAEGGGRVIGEVCHFIDLVQYLTGSHPVAVSAEAVPRTKTSGFVDDSSVISLGLGDGSIASIVYTASGDASVAKERVEVFCDRSVGLIDDFKSAEFVRGGRRAKFGGGAQDKGHASEIAAFFDAVRGKGSPPISLESLIATSLTCFAILESARTGSRIDLDAFRQSARLD
jgi:polar amino acid transport system substrate-binding protein